ncbi:MAG: chemotaxis protein CheW [Oceanococcaceae bacterium]
MTTPSLRLPERCVSFTLDRECFGVDVLQVREVLNRPDMTSVPGAGTACVGVINLRGRILTVLDLRLLLGLSSSTIDDSEHLLVIERAGRMVGLIVDSVGDVINLNPNADTTTRTSGSVHPDAMTMVHHGDCFVALLNLDHILENAA